MSEKSDSQGLFGRLKHGLAKTRTRLTDGLADLVFGEKTVDLETLDDLEALLLTADVGVEATQQIIVDLHDQLGRSELDDGQAVYRALHRKMTEMLASCEAPLQLPEAQPAVVLMVGVNGAGKTTSIGKLAQRLRNDGKSVLLAAGDTFRAAASEQLQAWGERIGSPVIAQQPGADPAAVIFDGLEAARSRQIDVVLADTSGRLHTQAGLMDELRKINRVIGKFDESAPHEVLLVLDAGNGQNALSQARSFGEAVGVTGLILTKLDGTAKGGIVFAIAAQLGIPIKFIGVGEGVEDLRPFSSADYVDVLLSK
jgi:fused signal recognition particle receptor